ncbi:MAG: phosphonate metabolism protein PhnH [Clostridiaceae bacterium BRH_c20a]|nr:MAG: phosphonate metabolism protein PhnH [Clostridiaceae bacterium BRH_c20a]
MFDHVHDSQKAYRKLVDSLAKPGTINSLKPESEKLDLSVNCNKSMLLLMLMLLDTEVTFQILSENSEKIAKYINQLTYAKTESLEKADFIFVLQDSAAEDFFTAIEGCKLGDLVNPHLSATLIIEVERITNEKQLILKGPGIKETNYAALSFAEDWVHYRAAKNAEYPLGVEIYFIDKEHNLLAIPRTTTISVKR